RAVVRDPDRAAGLAAIGVSLARGDVTDRESMRAPMAGCDALFHLAAVYKVGVRDPAEMERVNVEGTRNVLELMQELGVAKGVYTSTLAVFSDTRGKVPDEAYRFTGRHLSHYDRTKWVAHYEVAHPMVRRGLPLTVVMPGVVYGPGDTSQLRPVLVQYLQGKLRAAPKHAGVCWGFIDDIIEGHVLALAKGRPGDDYIIAGPPHRFVEAFEVASRITGVRPPRLNPGRGTMRLLAALAGLREKFGEVPPERTAEYLRVNQGVTYYGDNAKARREWGYAPRPLEEGLRATLEHEMRILGMEPAKAAG
ncbi:MAG TPA: NAD-dependent epimerase/dehydratase family protein, partial [Candidatus Thermoplasmatota archaeon]